MRPVLKHGAHERCIKHFSSSHVHFRALLRRLKIFDSEAGPPEGGLEVDLRRGGLEVDLRRGG